MPRPINGRRRLRMVAMVYLTSTCHTHPFYIYLSKNFVVAKPVPPVTAPMAAFFATFFATCLAAALVIFAAGFFAAHLATLPAALAAMRPPTFDTTENIPVPRCPLLGKIPRRL